MNIEEREPFCRLYLGLEPLINNEYVIIDRNKYQGVDFFVGLVIYIEGVNYVIINHKNLGSKIKLFVKKLQ